MTKYLLALALVASCTDVPDESQQDDDTVVLGGFFPIAVDYQKHDSFQKWQDRGINTVIRVPPDDNVRDWTDKANQLGLKMIREPARDPRDDRRESNLLAWHWMDEPELHGVPASQLADFRRHMHDIDPDMPISVNFWGGGMRLGDCYRGYCYKDYIAHADWISDDIYACNKYQCDVDVVGHAVRQLREWGDGQRVFAYIEASDFDHNGTGPSPRRFRAEVWDAIVHGARGVFYFPERVHPLDYDGAPADVIAEMKDTDAELAKLAPVLQRGFNPNAIAMNTPDALEVTWRRTKDAAYFFVLNPSALHHDNQELHLHGVRADSAHVVDEGRDVRLHGRDTIVDDFAPYEVHIYEVPNR